MTRISAPHNSLVATLLMFGALALSSHPASAQTFEGVVTMRITGVGRDQAPRDVDYLSRAGKVRINSESPMGSVSIIGVPSEKKMYVLMDARSMYLEVPLDASLLPIGDASGASAAPKVTRTGKKEIIADIECEHVTVEAAQQTTDVCVAKGLGPFINATNPMAALGGGGRGGSAADGWLRALGTDGLFPLKVTRQDGVVSMLVTKVDRKKLRDAQFAIPGNYTKMDLPRRP